MKNLCGLIICVLLQLLAVNSAENKTDNILAAGNGTSNALHDAEAANNSSIGSSGNGIEKGDPVHSVYEDSSLNLTKTIRVAEGLDMSLDEIVKEQDADKELSENVLNASIPASNKTKEDQKLSIAEGEEEEMSASNFTFHSSANDVLNPGFVSNTSTNLEKSLLEMPMAIQDMQNGDDSKNATRPGPAQLLALVQDIEIGRALWDVETNGSVQSEHVEPATLPLLTPQEEVDIAGALVEAVHEGKLDPSALLRANLEAESSWKPNDSSTATSDSFFKQLFVGVVIAVLAIGCFVGLVVHIISQTQEEGDRMPHNMYEMLEADSLYMSAACHPVSTANTLVSYTFPCSEDERNY